MLFNVFIEWKKCAYSIRASVFLPIHLSLQWSLPNLIPSHKKTWLKRQVFWVRALCGPPRNSTNTFPYFLFLSYHWYQTFRYDIGVSDSEISTQNGPSSFSPREWSFTVSALFFCIQWHARSINQFFNCSISFFILARKKLLKTKTFPPVISLRKIQNTKKLKISTGLKQFNQVKRGSWKGNTRNLKAECKTLFWKDVVFTYS